MFIFTLTTQIFQKMVNQQICLAVLHSSQF